MDGLIVWWGALSPDQKLILVCFVFLVTAFFGDIALWWREKHGHPRRRKQERFDGWKRCPNPTCFDGRDETRHGAWCETCRGLGVVERKRGDHLQT